MDTAQHGLRRELRLRDLVSMQVTMIVWLGWAGFAAKQGAGQVVLWLLAIVLFYLPLAAVVIMLSRAMPVEGGVYQWVKAGLSPFAGYMAAWNLTIYAITAYATTGSLLASGFAHAAGAWGPTLATSKLFALALTATSCLIALVFNIRGLRIAKWWSGAGATLTVGTFVMMLGLLIKAWRREGTAVRYAFALSWPGFSILTFSVFTKMALSALSGFDASAVFADECRKPENDVARSVMIAAPLIALMYILGTGAVLAWISPANVDLAATVPQLMQAGFGPRGFGQALTMSVTIAAAIAFLASMVVFVGMVARLPMVAGWDGLLPAWWSELHPVFRTPAKAVAMVTASVLLLGALSLAGAGNQEAVQAGVGAGGGSLCLMYMLLFAVVLAGSLAPRPETLTPEARLPGTPIPTPEAKLPGIPIAMRLAALAGFLVALAAFAFQIVPVGEVADRTVFAMKVAGTILVTNGLGALVYWRGMRRVNEPPGLRAPLD